MDIPERFSFAGTALHDLWETFLAWDAAGSLAHPWVLLGALVVGMLLVVGPTWGRIRNVITLFHELGHALAGLLVGGRVNGIHLRTDTSGVTNWSFAGNPGRLRSAWVAWWGYPMPPLVGAVGLGLVLTGHARAYLAGLTLLAVVVLVVWVRNSWGLFVVLVAALLLGGATWQGEWWPGVMGMLFVGMLLMGGWRTATEHLRDGRGPEGVESDSRVVARNILLPAVLVRTSFLAVAVVLPGAALFLALG